MIGTIIRHILALLTFQVAPNIKIFTGSWSTTQRSTLLMLCVTTTLFFDTIESIQLVLKPTTGGCVGACVICHDVDGGNEGHLFVEGAI